MKKRLFIFLLILCTGTMLRADEALRSAQQALKEQGYYFGEPDGTPGPETSAAIRRFQIRNGLQVTGTLNPETEAALKNGGETQAGETAPQPQMQQPRSAAEGPSAAAENDREFLDRTSKPRGRSAPLAPPLEAGTGDAFADLFARTPYESAPPEVQRSTLRRAQLKLARSGYYRGEIDGVPGPATARAIADYQSDKGLNVTGRLDMRTLSRMDLLPPIKAAPRVPVAPPVVEEPAGRRIYRGIWVR